MFWSYFFLLLSSFFFLSFPRLISAVADSMSTILAHISANLECRSEMYRTQKIAKNRHLGIIAQLCRTVSLQLRHVSTIGKKLD